MSRSIRIPPVEFIRTEEIKRFSFPPTRYPRDIEAYIIDNNENYFRISEEEVLKLIQSSDKILSTFRHNNRQRYFRLKVSE